MRVTARNHDFLITADRDVPHGGWGQGAAGRSRAEAAGPCGIGAGRGQRPAGEAGLVGLVLGLLGPAACCCWIPVESLSSASLAAGKGR